MIQYVSLAVGLLLVIAAAIEIKVAIMCLKEARNLERRNAGMDEASPHEGKDGSKEFDEGFENIMRFSVNGKTGFERE